MPVVVALLFFLIVLRPLVRMLAAMPAKRPPMTTAPENETESGSLQPKEIPLEKQVIDWANKNPRHAAGLVKGWLKE